LVLWKWEFYIQKFPKALKPEIIDPYLSIKNNEARINLRIIDSQENLRRNDLINKINFDLKNKIGLDESEYKLAGVLILFNNLLQSLFKSQILTFRIGDDWNIYNVYNSI
jgi:hypothetical protein